jgi:hypothetical protein
MRPAALRLVQFGRRGHLMETGAMGKALLWLEFSAAVLLLHATIAACIARLSRRTVRWLLYALLCWPGLIGYGLLTAFVARWRFGFGAEHFPIEYVG